MSPSVQHTFNLLTTKDWNQVSDIISSFSNELLATYLRHKLEKDNKSIREAIVEKAINWPLDESNFISLDTDKIQENQEKNQSNSAPFLWFFKVRYFLLKC